MRADATTLPIARAEGGPRERGRAIGLALGAEINRSLAFYRRIFERRSLDPERAIAPYLTAAEAALPELVEQLRATANAAEVPFAELFAVNAFEELDEGTTPDRCSTFAAAVPGATILGHNEMWLAGDVANVALVVDRPEGGPAVVSPTAVCCLPAVGVNAHGVAQGIDSLTARDDRVGVPRVLVSRHALDARDRADALRRAALAGRAGGYAHTFALRGGGTIRIETTAERVVALEGPGGHANHYLALEHLERGDEPSAGSRSRQARLEELLAERPPESPDDAMAILRDHASEPQAICHHPDSAEEDEGSAVCFSLVAELEAGRLWVAAGSPCDTPYEEVDLSDVV